MTFRALRALLLGLPVAAAAAEPPPDFRFASIDGGEIALDDLREKGPVLVVNTASRCGFAPQYDGLQALADRYGPRGLTVLAVPSNDFRQELGSGSEVRDFCAVNFDLTIPMTEITHVRGAEAHPFYRWLKQTHGFTPRWNFQKVLIAPDGTLAGTWGSFTGPTSDSVTRSIEALLP